MPTNEETEKIVMRYIRRCEKLECLNTHCDLSTIECLRMQSPADAREWIKKNGPKG